MIVYTTFITIIFIKGMRSVGFFTIKEFLKKNMSTSVRKSGSSEQWIRKTTRKETSFKDIRYISHLIP